MMMSEEKVTRYSSNEAGMFWEADGAYVAYADYEQQASTIAALKEQLAGARNAALEEAVKACELEAAAASVPHNRKACWQSEIAGNCAAAIRALASQPAAPVQPEPKALNEGEEIALLCKIEDYMLVTDHLGSQTHPDSVAAEKVIYALVNSFIAARRAAPPVQQPDDVREDVPAKPGDRTSDGIFTSILSKNGATVYNALKAAGQPVHPIVSRAKVESQALATTRPGAALTILQEICDKQKRHYGEGTTHIELSRLCDEARAILAASGGAEHQSQQGEGSGK